jgi:hypothetical protein
MIEANDGGVNVSFTAGRSWSDQDFATSQFYHVATTDEFPYKICGAQQDNSTLCGPSRKQGGIPTSDWVDAGGGESGYVTPHPTKPDIIFAGSYGGLMTRKDLNTAFERNITVWPDNPMGYSSEDIKVASSGPIRSSSRATTLTWSMRPGTTCTGRLTRAKAGRASRRTCRVTTRRPWAPRADR